MRKCKGVKSGERGRNSTFSHLPNQPFRNSPFSVLRILVGTVCRRKASS